AVQGRIGAAVCGERSILIDERHAGLCRRRSSMCARRRFVAVGGRVFVSQRNCESARYVPKLHPCPLADQVAVHLEVYLVIAGYAYRWHVVIADDTLPAARSRGTERCA